MENTKLLWVIQCWITRVRETVEGVRRCRGKDNGNSGSSVTEGIEYQCQLGIHRESALKVEKPQKRVERVNMSGHWKSIWSKTGMVFVELNMWPYVSSLMYKEAHEEVAGVDRLNNVYFSIRYLKMCSLGLKSMKILLPHRKVVIMPCYLPL